MNDSPVQGMEFRDFLFYIVPGTVSLLAICLLAQPSLATFKEYGGLATSLIAVILAYGMGHLAYTAQYLVRPTILRILRGGLHPAETEALRWKESDADFINAWMWLQEADPALYDANIGRPRNIARFSLSMILPTMFLGAVLVWRLNGSTSWIVGIATGLAVVLWTTRFARFDRMYRSRVFYGVRLHNPYPELPAP